jgi:hypothetical protein
MPNTYMSCYCRENVTCRAISSYKVFNNTRHVGFDGFAAVTMKNVVLWGVGLL